MEILTSNYRVFCDTFNTDAEVKMHEVKGKRKLSLTIADTQESHQISLWKEDVVLLAEVLRGMADNLDSRLK